MNVVFRKSTYSSDSWNCVEVAAVPSVVLVRDSKNPGGPVLSFSPGAWVEFVTAVRGRDGGML